MKVAMTLLIAGFLLVTVSVSGADNPAASPAAASVEAGPEAAPTPQALPAELQEKGTFASPAGGCDPAIASGLQATPFDPPKGTLQEPDPVPAAQTCGACSSSNCVGAPRGQSCYLGSGQGWGHCNIYSGGFMCPTGGWECQCGSGPLP